MHAARNSALCTKDCLCLFVCPTGATDTETGQIDFARCLDGCRLCVDACPSHAIYLVMDSYAPPQEKDDSLSSAMQELMGSKLNGELISSALASADGQSPETASLMRAFAHSDRILAEDCARESGFMLPQSREILRYLEELKERRDAPAETIDRLLELIRPV